MLLGGGRDLSPAPLPHFLPRATYNGGGHPNCLRDQIAPPPIPPPPCLLPTAPLEVGGSSPPRPVLELPPPVWGRGGGAFCYTTPGSAPPPPPTPRGSTSPPPVIYSFAFTSPLPPSFPPPPRPLPRARAAPPRGGGPAAMFTAPPIPGGVGAFLFLQNKVMETKGGGASGARGHE